MTSTLKTFSALNSRLTFGSLFLAHLFIFPWLYSSLPPSVNLFPKSLNLDDVDNREAAVIRGIEVEIEDSSLLLAHLTDDEDVYSDLYVATKSYLNETELSEDGSDEKHSFSILNAVINHSSADPASVPRVISTLKLQGKQNFAVDDFVNQVDITDIISGQRNWAKRGAGDLGIDVQATDGSGDPSGNGSGTEHYDASGSDESGSGGDGDNSGGDSSGSEGGSGMYGDTSGDGRQSGSGSDGDACGGDSSGMEGASGASGDSSGDHESGSGSKKSKECCVIQ